MMVLGVPAGEGGGRSFFGGRPAGVAARNAGAGRGSSVDWGVRGHGFRRSGLEGLVAEGFEDVVAAFE